MGLDVTYTNGVIAARENRLLGDKLLRMCEAKPEDAFRILTESGYGAGAEAVSPYDYERMTAAEEAALDDFVREYAPSPAESVYFLAPRDFHNAKALVKAAYLGSDAEKMLAPEGLVPVAKLKAAVSGEKTALPYKELDEAIRKAAAYLTEGGSSGAETGGIFERAQYACLSRVCQRNPALKKLLAMKADMNNILTAVRAGDPARAERQYLSGGTLDEKKLSVLCGADADTAKNVFSRTPYADFVRLCLAAKGDGKPPTEAEKKLDSCEADYFSARKYELEGTHPFLYYVFRRRAENADVRIVFVCLLAGMKEQEIKARLRGL